MTLKQHIVSQTFQNIILMHSGGFKVNVPPEKSQLCKTIKANLREWFDLPKISIGMIWINFQISSASPKKVFDAQFGIYITFLKDIQGHHGMWINPDTLEVISQD